MFSLVAHKIYELFLKSTEKKYKNFCSSNDHQCEKIIVSWALQQQQSLQRVFICYQIYPINSTPQFFSLKKIKINSCSCVCSCSSASANIDYVCALKSIQKQSTSKHAKLWWWSEDSRQSRGKIHQPTRSWKILFFREQSSFVSSRRELLCVRWRQLGKLHKNSLTSLRTASLVAVLNSKKKKRKSNAQHFLCIAISTSYWERLHY